MPRGKNPAAVALGRLGGAASRKNLTAEQKKELGQRAAAGRWGKMTVAERKAHGAMLAAARAKSRKKRASTSKKSGRAK